MKVEEIDDLLTRGVATFVDPEGKFKEKLLKKIKGEDVGEIIIKFGVDPTRPDLHLGHAVVLQKLRKFQNLGCKVVFLVGDFTALIGDPTGKSKVRPEVEVKEIQANMKTYLEQVGKILTVDNPNVFSWIMNSDWFLSPADIDTPTEISIKIGNEVVNKGSFMEKAAWFEQTRMQITNLRKTEILGVTLRNLFWTLKHITQAQLIERDMFQERLETKKALYMHEMLYPVLQATDSYAIYIIYGKCDMEIGGTDQTFNMLMGREVMKTNNQEPQQAVMSMDILVGTDGKEKMSKSLDNYIGITDEPPNIFGKIMSIPDSIILNYYKLCTSADTKRVEDIAKKLKDGKFNPRDIKLDLAEEVISIYHGSQAAEAARDAFIATFQKKEIPDNLEVVTPEKNEALSDLLVRTKIIASKTEWRRLVEDGAIKFLIDGEDEEKITDPTRVATTGVYKIGKRRFIRVK